MIKLNENDIYISIDVETDGPIPGRYSMLSLGAAMFDGTGSILSAFKVNLDYLPNAVYDPKTMAWWRTQSKAWKTAREDPVPPATAMTEFIEWLGPGPRTAICYPAGFDFMFIYWYLMQFIGTSPFGFSCIDIKTMASTVLGMEFRKTSKRTMPKAWFEGCGKHTHTAKEDAIEQGRLFFNIINSTIKE